MKETPQSVYQWCEETFPQYLNIKARATALLEEAVELSIAAGLSTEDIQAAVQVPIQKAAGRTQDEGVEGEVADVLICVYALAGTAGFNAQEELDKKMEVNRSRNAEYYAKKLQQKLELGMKL